MLKEKIDERERLRKTEREDREESAIFACFFIIAISLLLVLAAAI